MPVDLSRPPVNHAPVPPAPSPVFVDVSVEPHEALPEGLALRFKAAPGAVAGVIERTLYAPEDSPGAPRWHRVEGRGEGEVPLPARAIEVEDSAAGVSTLVYGGVWGLRLFPEEGGAARAETHLLLPAGGAG